MKKKELTNSLAVEIGLLVATSASIILLLLSCLYLLMVFPFFLVLYASSILGALLGMKISTNRVGTWVGAVLAELLGVWVFFSMISNMSFD